MVNTDKEISDLISIRKEMETLIDDANLKTPQDRFEFTDKDPNYIKLFNRVSEIEDIIAKKVKPLINKAIDEKDYNKAKKIAAKAYQGQESAGLVLLFRQIIFRQNKQSS